MSYIMDELSGKWLAASVHFAVCAAFCRRITQTNHGTTINDVAGETKGPSQRVLSHFNIIWVSWSRNVTDMLAKSANLSRRIWSNGLSWCSIQPNPLVVTNTYLAAHTHSASRNVASTTWLRLVTRAAKAGTQCNPRISCSAKLSKASKLWPICGTPASAKAASSLCCKKGQVEWLQRSSKWQVQKGDVCYICYICYICCIAYLNHLSLLLSSFRCWATASQAT